MTQNFTNISSSDIVGTSLDPLKDRDQAAKTSFMGTSLPTVDAQDVGMAVVIIKTENNVLTRQIWRLVGFEDNQPVWQIERDLNRGLVYSNNNTDKEIADYQPINSMLTSLSAQEAQGTQTNINSFPYLSGKNTFSLSTITATGRALLAAADAATARSTLGLGSLATKSSVTGSDLAANTVTLGNLATGTYNHTISYSSVGTPMLVPLPAGVPVGAVIMWPSTVLPPDNTWVFLAGQQLAISEYQELWAFASGSNNIVSGSIDDWRTNRPGSFYQESETTFRVPDLRNMFVRAWDGPEGPTRTVGNKQGDAIRNITGEFTGGRTGNVDRGAFYHGGRDAGVGSGSSFDQHHVYFDASRVVPTADENRPVNVFIPFIMKAKSLA